MSWWQTQPLLQGATTSVWRCSLLELLRLLRPAGIERGSQEALDPVAMRKGKLPAPLCRTSQERGAYRFRPRGTAVTADSTRAAVLAAALREAREVTGASGSEPPQELAARWEAEQLPGQKEAIEVKIAELQTQAEAMDTVDPRIVRDYNELKENP